MLIGEDKTQSHFVVEPPPKVRSAKWKTDWFEQPVEFVTLLGLNFGTAEVGIRYL